MNKWISLQTDILTEDHYAYQEWLEKEEEMTTLNDRLQQQFEDIGSHPNLDWENHKLISHLKEDLSLIHSIKNPSERMFRIFLNKCPEDYKLFDLSDDMIKFVINKKPTLIYDFENPSDELKMIAIKSQPSLINNIEEPTKEMFEYVVKEYPNIFKRNATQTVLALYPELFIEIAKSVGDIFEYVEEKHLDIPEVKQFIDKDPSVLANSIGECKRLNLPYQRQKDLLLDYIATDYTLLFTMKVKTVIGAEGAIKLLLRNIFDADSLLRRYNLITKNELNRFINDLSAENLYTIIRNIEPSARFDWITYSEKVVDKLLPLAYSNTHLYKDDTKTLYEIRRKMWKMTYSDKYGSWFERWSWR